MRLVLCALVAAGALTAPAAAEAELLDRAVVRFSSPELRGPRFVLERALAFEARLEALSAARDGSAEEAAPYAERHVRAALERHVAETLLASLRIDPEPPPAEVERQMGVARAMLMNAVGGEQRLLSALRAEGIGAQGLRRLLRRRARASLYLHHMVAPMLTPSAAELRRALPASPFAGQKFARVEPLLRRWLVARALREAVGAFYQNARTRLSLTVLGRRGSDDGATSAH
jgi:hypothetical protein